ncbi:MAG: FecR domain-containing protein [Pseudobdellovibrionaceae bacterium]
MKFHLFILMQIFALSANAWTVIVMTKPNAQWINVLDEKNPLKVGQFLAFGDTVITGPGTKLKLVEQHSVMVIGENSTVKIEESPYKDGVPHPATLFLQNGTLRLQVDPPEAKKYRYKIPSIVAGVRGTEFVLAASKEKEVLCVLEGSVEAEISATKKKAVVKKNIGWIREGLDEGKLLPTTVEQRQEWVKATSL